MLLNWFLDKKLRYYLYVLYASILISAAALSTSFLSKNIVNFIVSKESTMRNVMIWGTIFFLTFFAFVFAKRYFQCLVVNCNRKIINQIFDSILWGKYENVSNENYGHITSILLKDLNAILQFIEKVFPYAVESFVVALATGITALYMDKTVFCVVFIMSIVSSISLFIGKRAAELEKDKLEALDAANQRISEAFRAIPILKSIQNSYFLFDDIKQLTNLSNTREFQKVKLIAKYDVLTRITNVIREMFVIVYGCVYAELDVGTIVAILNITSFFSDITISFGNIFIQYKNIKVALNRIKKLITTEREEMLLTEIDIINSVDILEFKNVNFMYRDGCGVKDFSFKCFKGQLNVIFGEMGTGKSTIGKILCGLIQPEYGSVNIDGISKDLVQLRKNCSYISQDGVVMHGTIADNITSFSEYIDEKKMNDIIVKVGLREWVESLPYGIGSFIDSETMNLSGGQRHRISIARGLYKDAAIFLFDEPTLALDEVSVRTILELLDELKSEKLVLVITHDERILGISNINIIQMK